MNPIRHISDVNIYQLRSLQVDPAYFGLGFIQLKISDSERLHFYHDDLPVLADEPHDHRYHFISHILQGEFTQTIYSWEDHPNGSWSKHWEDCRPNSITPMPPKHGRISEIMTNTYQAGSYYSIEADTLHTVSASGNCITSLARETPYKDYAAVVRMNGIASVCPFSQPIPVEQCWEMIADMLPKTTAISQPGYHLVDIPRGEVGEVSKIIEEAHELLDAHNQGIRIMTQIEMSDLYGALDRYRERYHPELSFEDLDDMYRVTRRAFDNGRRT
jgi:hypothetical protein